MRTNPKNKVVTQADIKKIKQTIADEMLEISKVLFFTVLLDKEGMSSEDLHRILGEVNDLSDSILLGYVNISDLKNTLKQEQGLVFTRGR